MRALITGANGLIGSHIARELLGANHSVRGLVRASSDLRSLQGLELELIRGDVCDKVSLIAAMEHCDVVFHTAAHFAYAGTRLEQLNQLAVEGTTNVLEAAKESAIKRVVLTSSSVVCGSSHRPLVRNEMDQLDAGETTPYVLSKQKQEQLAFELARVLGLELVAACPTMTIGPRDHRLGPSNGVIVAYLNDPLRTSFPGGCNMVSVQDVARGHVLLAQRGGRASVIYWVERILSGSMCIAGSHNSAVLPGPIGRLITPPPFWPPAVMSCSVSSVIDSPSPPVPRRAWWGVIIGTITARRKPWVTPPEPPVRRWRRRSPGW